MAAEASGSGSLQTAISPSLGMATPGLGTPQASTPANATTAVPAATGPTPAAQASASGGAGAGASTSRGPAPPTAAAAAAAAAGSTVLTTLHALLRAHVAAHPSPTMPYLHPYAPGPGLKKGRASGFASASTSTSTGSGSTDKAGSGGGGGGGEDDLAALKSVREAVDGAKSMLGRGEKERVRLARAMREVITHESALLPLGTTLSTLPPAARPLGHLCALPPSDLLSALGKRLGLQVFAEDSQFGLLRTSLTLAGSRFVVDVDLEADAGDDADDATEPPTAAATPIAPNGQVAAQAAALSSLGVGLTAAKALNERGKVRLAKLTANHVTPAGEAGKADWVGRVLRSALETHLEVWNRASNAERSVQLERSSRALETVLAELKALDELAEAASGDDADLFADLEGLAAGVQRVCAGEEDGWRVYPDPSACMFPSFRLLDAAPSVRNPAFRLRPARRDEHVPPPMYAETDDADENAMAVDAVDPAAGADKDAMQVDSNPGGADANGTTTAAATVSPMCRGRWVVEYVDDARRPSGGGGLVVRRTWLVPGPEEGEASAWSPSIKVEGLLHQIALETDGAAPVPPLFPLGAEFVHPASASDAGDVAQHWVLGVPGPEGYVVGRVGLPVSWSEMGRLVHALRAQLVLDVLFMGAFSPPTIVAATNDNDDDMDGADDDLADLDAAPTAIPLTATLFQRSLRVTFPLNDTAATVDIKPIDAQPHVAITVTVGGGVRAQGGGEGMDGGGSGGPGALDDATAAEACSTAGVDAVEIVRRVYAALRKM